MVETVGRTGLLVLIALVLGAGCRGRGSDVSERESDPEQVQALRRSISSGMRAISFDKLTQAHVGQLCVVTASTPKERTPTPPPLGAMHVLGDISLYKAELESIGADRITLRARRPSGNYWTVEVEQERITSILITP